MEQKKKPFNEKEHDERRVPLPKVTNPKPFEPGKELQDIINSQAEQERRYQQWINDDMR